MDKTVGKGMGKERKRGGWWRKKECGDGGGERG